MLPNKLEPLNQDDEEFKILMKYMNQGRAAEGSDASCLERIKVNSIFKTYENIIRSEDENQLFSNLHNHW